MKSKYRLQDLFSRNEILFGGYAIALVLAGCAVFIVGPAGFSGTGLRYATGLILIVAAPILVVVAREHISCPTCGKDPMLRAKGNSSWFELYVLKHRYNWWPESECSECGTKLDIRP